MVFTESMVYTLNNGWTQWCSSNYTLIPSLKTWCILWSQWNILWERTSMALGMVGLWELLVLLNHGDHHGFLSIWIGGQADKILIIILLMISTILLLTKIDFTPSHTSTTMIMMREWVIGQLMRNYQMLAIEWDFLLIELPYSTYGRSITRSLESTRWAFTNMVHIIAVTFIFENVLVNSISEIN